MLYPKVWGGDRLARLGKPVKPGDAIGESWELADMGHTSASGAGGGAARSVIASGALEGRTLHDAIGLWGHHLLGRAKISEEGFPLLVKFLDAKENLSVQVHPSPAYAAKHPQAKLKTECWYILDAEPGAVIYKGIHPHVTREQFRAHIADGTVASDMIAVPAIPGECHNLPSGTCHALGAGVLVAEVQTPSDTTFRVFDWGRTGRELHVEQALECIDFPASETLHATRLLPGQAHARLVTTAFFTLDEHALQAGSTLEFGEACGALIVLSGEGQLRHTHAAHPPVSLTRGITVLVPAQTAGDTRLHAGLPMRLLRAGLVD